MTTAEFVAAPVEDIERTGVTADTSDPATQEILAAIEEGGGDIPYSLFMSHSLYGTHGLYTSGRATINESGLAAALWGSSGFSTSASSYVFNETIAQFGRTVDESLGRPDVATILEVGAGRGTTASDVLSRLRRAEPDLYGRLDYRIIEPGDLREKQVHTILGYAAGTPSDNPIDIHGLRGEGDSDLSKVTWTTGSATDVEMDPFDGLIFSHEVPDAFPIEVVRNADGRLQQKFIAVQDGEWVKKWKQPTDEVLAYLQKHNIVVQSGRYETVNPDAEAYQHNINRMLSRGAILTLDYGQFGQENAEKLPLRFYPEAAAKRTAQAEGLTYEQLTYRHPGMVDITAHINFDPMRRAAEQDDLTVAFAGLQSAFLLANGFPMPEALEAAKFTPRESNRYGEKVTHPLHREEETINARLARAARVLGKDAFKALVVTKDVELLQPVHREWRFPRLDFW